MSGDLEIRLFLFSSAVLAGYEAMKATKWRMWVFWALCGGFAIAGAAWSWIENVYPPITSRIAEVATNTESWFLLFVLVLVLVAATGKPRVSQDEKPDDDRLAKLIGKIGRRLDLLELKTPAQYDDNPMRALINDVMQKQASLEAELKQRGNESDKIGTLNRTAFLLATDAVQKGYKIRLEKLKEIIPFDTTLPAGTVISDEYLLTQCARIDGFLVKLTNQLHGSRWTNGLAYLLSEAERRADHELKNSGSPEGVNPYAYREFHIACMKRDALAEFLDRSLNEAQAEEAQMLGLLREQAGIKEKR